MPYLHQKRNLLQKIKEKLPVEIVKEQKYLGEEDE